MVIYEVTASIDEDIYNEYHEWLLEHVAHMLTFDGFDKAEIGIIEQKEPSGKQQLRISFMIDFYDNLQDYLDNHAPSVRAESQKRFGDKYSVERRIILDPVTLTA